MIPFLYHSRNDKVIVKFQKRLSRELGSQGPLWGLFPGDNIGVSRESGPPCPDRCREERTWRQEVRYWLTLFRVIRKTTSHFSISADSVWPQKPSSGALNGLVKIGKTGKVLVCLNGGLETGLKEALSSFLDLPFPLLIPSFTKTDGANHQQSARLRVTLNACRNKVQLKCRKERRKEKRLGGRKKEGNRERGGEREGEKK